MNISKYHSIRVNTPKQANDSQHRVLEGGQWELVGRVQVTDNGRPVEMMPDKRNRDELVEYFDTKKKWTPGYWIVFKRLEMETLASD